MPSARIKGVDAPLCGSHGLARDAAPSNRFALSMVDGRAAQTGMRRMMVFDIASESHTSFMGTISRGSFDAPSTPKGIPHREAHCC
jgi:hypothetical protein